MPKVASKTPRGEIRIDPTYCTGCGYCAHFCAQGCIDIVDGKAVFANPSNCNGCMICGWMCYGLAIEVYKWKT